MDINASFGAKLKEVSETLVLSDPTDAQALCAAHTRLQEIAQEAEEKALADWFAVSNAAATLLQDIILNDAKNPEATLKTLCSTVSAMQLACENRNLKDAILPSALGVDMRKFKDAAPSSKDAPSPKRPKDSFTVSYIASLTNAIGADAGLVGDFVSESMEHLDACNGHLLGIESNSGDFEAINAVFRAFHTIKGVASFLNLSEIRTLAHQSENILDKARAGKIELKGLSLDLIFEAVDTMKLMMDDLKKGLNSGSVQCSVTKYGELLEGLQKLCAGEAQNGKSQPYPSPSCPPSIAKEEEDASTPDGEESFSLPQELLSSELPRFLDEMNEHLETADKSMLALEDKPDDQETLNAIFRAFHTIKGSAGFLGLTPVESLAHKAESFLGKVRDGIITLKNEKADLCFSAIDALKRMSIALKDAAPGGAMKLPEFHALEEKLSAVNERASGHHPLQQVKADHHPMTQTLSSTALIRKTQVKETVKVDAERLDKLIDAIGELVIAETMVVQSGEVKSISSPHLVQTLSQLDKITRELQEMGMALRMVPISGTFQKMARLVRDLSKKIGKEIEFHMEGEDTELDKNVVDSIGDPLVHMVRNAVDHGIEKMPEDRTKTGKPAKGKVSLKAFHKGGSIYIEVSDDGRGLDKEAIFRKAVERGIVQSDEELSDKEIFALIFEPGFSTAEKITEVSGRGVGMDVVKRNIEALRGQVEIQSVLGKGSVFSIRLPLTLAIIDGMVVSVGGERYIIPTLSIVMSVCVKDSDIKTVQGRGRMVQLQGQLIPIFNLSSLFDSANAQSGGRKDMGETLIVIVEADGERTGIAIEELLGQQQIVIKSLGDYLKGAPGIAGGAIMPDGNVGLILDVGGLVRLANETH